MKIAHIVCTFPPYRGGMGNSAYEFCRHLAKLGHDVTVFTPNYRVDKESEIMDGVNVHRLKTLVKFGNAAIMLGLVRELDSFDIVHLHYPFFGTAELIWLWKKRNPKKKLIVHFHMDVLGLSSLAKVFTLPDTLIRKNLFRSADAVICSSFDYLESSSLASIYPEIKSKTHEVLFGVDLERFKGVKGENGNKALRLLFVGGLDSAHHFKGLHVLFDALTSLKDKSWSLDIVGSGNLVDSYKKLVQDNGLSDRVDFIGPVSPERLPAMYQSADVFVLASTARNEAFGLVLLEAMASGTAVIASALPGVRMVFENERQGFLVAPNNPDDLAEKLEYLINHREIVSEMGEAGRRLTEERYRWEDAAERLQEIYEGLAK